MERSDGLPRLSTRSGSDSRLRRRSRFAHGDHRKELFRNLCEGLGSVAFAAQLLEPYALVHMLRRRWTSSPPTSSRDTEVT